MVTRSHSGHTWKPRTVTLGPVVIRNLFVRSFAPHAVLLTVAIAACLYHHNWGWFGVSGSITAISGVVFMSRRLIRYGVKRVDDDSPPPTWPDGQFNVDSSNEMFQRAIDNWHTVIGLWLVVVGTLIAGAVPFALELLVPFRAE